MTEAAVRLEGVRHVYAGDPPVVAVENISIEASKGSFVSLLGPSGCGKSTILRVLAGLIAPTEGTASIDGQSAVGCYSLAAHMPQRDLLLPWRRVEANATLGAEIAGIPRAEARSLADGLYERFGLDEFVHAWPSQLSGGMRQRLALLRTFLMPRSTLLLDEPLGALDALTRREMQEWLENVWQSDRRTVLLVTHDIEEALLLSDVVYVMSPRPGHIVARIDVNLARPRRTSVIISPGFVELKERVLEALHMRP